MSCPLFEQREKSSLPEIITSRLPKRVYQGVKSPPETESACLESVRWTPDPYFRYFSKSGIFKMAPKTAGWIQLKEKYSENSARTQKNRTNYISNWSGNTTQQNIPASRCCKSFGNLFLAKIWRAQKKHNLSLSLPSDCASVTLQKGAGLCRYAAFDTQHNALCDRIQLWYDCFYLHFYPKAASSCYGRPPHQTTEGVYLLSM